jgi:hypothetical protein
MIAITIRHCKDLITDITVDFTLNFTHFRLFVAKTAAKTIPCAFTVPTMTGCFWIKTYFLSWWGFRPFEREPFSEDAVAMS